MLLDFDDAAVRAFLAVELCGPQSRLFLGMLGFLAEQSLPILLRNLIIIGVDFGEGEETVPVAAIIDERRLKRRLDPRNLG